MFKSFFLNKKWLLWSWGGGLFLILSLLIQVTITVKINEWYKGFYDLLQKPTENDISMFWDKILEFMDTFLEHRFRESGGELKEPVVFDAESDFYKAVYAVFPTDQLKALQQQSFKSEEDLVAIRQVLEVFYEERRLSFPPDFFEKVLIRQVFLETVDRKWVDHLHNMDILRDGIGLRAYGQRDPLLEYKIEAFDMFALMMDAIAEDSFSVVSRAVIVQESA